MIGTVRRIVRRARLAVDQVRNGGWELVVADVQRLLWSETESVGFHRSLVDGDLADRSAVPSAGVPLRAVPLDDQLATAVFDEEGLGARDQLFLDRRRDIWEAGFDGGFVVVDDDQQPVYLQWLIPPRQHDRIVEHFGALFADIGPTTLLVEGAWVPAAARGRRMMPESLALVTEAAAAAFPEADDAVCFVTVDNKGAQVGTRSAGYPVRWRRIERYRFGRRTLEFVSATEAEFEHLARFA